MTTPVLRYDEETFIHQEITTKMSWAASQFFFFCFTIPFSDCFQLSGKTTNNGLSALCIRAEARQAKWNPRAESNTCPGPNHVLCSFLPRVINAGKSQHNEDQASCEAVFVGKRCSPRNDPALKETSGDADRVSHVTTGTELFPRAKHQS